MARGYRPVWQIGIKREETNRTGGAPASAKESRARKSFLDSPARKILPIGSTPSSARRGWAARGFRSVPLRRQLSNYQVDNSIMAA